jgi:TAT (twin-arginine translocation) pathway signal sequence
MNRRGFLKATLASAAAIVTAPLLFKQVCDCNRLHLCALHSGTGRPWDMASGGWISNATPVPLPPMTLEQLQKTQEAIEGLRITRDYYVIDWPPPTVGLWGTDSPVWKEWRARQEVHRAQRRQRIQAKWDARKRSREWMNAPVVDEVYRNIPKLTL